MLEVHLGNRFLWYPFWGWCEREPEGNHSLRGGPVLSQIHFSGKAISFGLAWVRACRKFICSLLGLDG